MEVTYGRSSQSTAYQLVNGHLNIPRSVPLTSDNTLNWTWLLPSCVELDVDVTCVETVLQVQLQVACAQHAGRCVAAGCRACVVTESVLLQLYPK